MFNSILIETLKCFTKEELKRFDDFVSSPFYNKKTAVVKLFRYIKKYAPDYDSEKMRKETVWTSLFPDKSYNYGVMKNLIYELTRLSESFLQFQVFDSKYYKKQFYLLENLNHRSNKKLFSAKFKFLEEKIRSQKEFTPEIYEQLRDLNILDYDYHFMNIAVCKDKDLTYKIAEYQIYYSLIECFKNYNNIIAFKLRNNYSKEINVTDVFLKETVIEDFLNKIKVLSEFDFTILNTYYLMYLATKYNDNINYYYLYKSFLIKNDHYFNHQEKRLLYNFLETSLTLNDKIPNRNKEYFEIDKIRINRKIILDENKNISFNEFTGIVKTASDFMEIDFLKGFINSYLRNVPEPVRKSAENFSMAYLYYTNNDYDKSLDIINNFDMNSSEYRLNLRALKLKILYDKKDFLSFEYTMDSFRHYLAKDIIPDSYKIPYLNFCKFLNKLFKVREIDDTNELFLLKKEISNDNTANKSWMLNKIEELYKK